MYNIYHVVVFLFYCEVRQSYMDGLIDLALSIRSPTYVLDFLCHFLAFLLERSRDWHVNGHAITLSQDFYS